MNEQTQLYSKDFRGLQFNSLEEIEFRLQRGYLDRLKLRVKKLRRLMIERNWEKLRVECHALATSGDSFGFREVARLAAEVQNCLPLGKIPQASTPPRAKASAERLVTKIDSILVLHSKR